MKKRIGSLLLSLALCLSLLPTTALAAGEDTHTNHCICGATHANVGNHTAATSVEWTGTDSLPNTAGNYYLTADVTITETWQPANGTFLCLNGHSITCNAGTNSDKKSTGVDVIKVTSGVTLTITDCQNTAGKITHASNKFGRGVDVNSGTFNLYGGSITGNTPSSTAYGGGVYVNGNDGEFNMYGGSITGNSTANYGGGVCVGRGSTFNMYGGKITGNTKKGTYSLSGGGVYVDKLPDTNGDTPNKSGTFNMSGGEITGNNASNGGGVCVVSPGIFNMSGGEITGNNANPGGVYVNGGTFTVSGTAKVTDNMRSGILSSETGKYSGGIASNVYLNTGKTITVGGALTGGEGSIGVTTANAPTSPNYVVIAKPGTGYTLTNDDKAAFTPDGGTTNYHIVLDRTNDQLKLGAGATPPHSHSWTYAQNNEYGIKATCNADGCPYSTVTVIICSPVAGTLCYDGNTHAAVLNPSVAGVFNPTITYTKDGEPFTGTPTDAGTYTASITLGGVTASTGFTIHPKPVTTATVDTISDQNYTGSQIKPAVTVKDGSTTIPASEYTVEYSNNINAGTATVTITDKTGGNYTLTTVTQNFTINKASYSGTVSDKTVPIVKGRSAAQTGSLTAADFLATPPAGAKIEAVSSGTFGIINTLSVAGGTLSYTSNTNIAATADETYTVTISSTNYNDFTATLKFHPTDKQTQAALTINSANSVTYGQTLTLSTTGGSSGGAVSYAVSAGTGTATVAGAVLTPTKAGTVTVVATMAGDDTYEAVSSAPFTVTIAKATPTGTPKYTAITTSGKTLADANLTTEGGTFSVAGSVQWVQDDGVTTLDNTTAVAANTAYKWLFTPTDGDNYNTLTGTITLYSVSTGSTVSRSPIAVEQTENGSVTVSPKSAGAGTTVTITVTPDSGYTLESLTVLDRNGKAIPVTEKNGKYTFTMPASKVTVQASFAEETPAVESTFADVSTDAYYAAAVAWAVENGITNGVNENEFGPDLSCTRAQIVTFLWRAAGCPEPKSTSGFSDVSADAYYAKAVAWAVENGITGGVGNGKFDPDATCTRAQSAAFLYRAAGSPAVSGGAAFSDVSSAAYYAAAVAWAAQQGITGGIGGDLFGSDNDCTRAQIVTLLYRYFVK